MKRCHAQADETLPMLMKSTHNSTTIPNQCISLLFASRNLLNIFIKKMIM